MCQTNITALSSASTKSPDARNSLVGWARPTRSLASEQAECWWAVPTRQDYVPTKPSVHLADAPRTHLAVVEISKKMVSGMAAARPAHDEVMGRATGDCEPNSSVLQPVHLWKLTRSARSMSSRRVPDRDDLHQVLDAGSPAAGIQMPSLISRFSDAHRGPFSCNQLGANTSKNRSNQSRYSIGRHIKSGLVSPKILVGAVCTRACHFLGAFATKKTFRKGAIIKLVEAKTIVGT